MNNPKILAMLVYKFIPLQYKPWRENIYPFKITVIH